MMEGAVRAQVQSREERTAFMWGPRGDRRRRNSRRGRLPAYALILFLIGIAVLPALTPRLRAAEETSALESLLPQAGRRAGASPPPARAPSVRRQAAPGTNDGIGALSVDPSAVASKGGGWERFKNFPLIRRVRSVGAWVQCLVRFVASIPKAIFQGDSRGMISALGDLLSRSSPPAGASPQPGSRSDDGPERSRGPTNLSID